MPVRDCIDRQADTMTSMWNSRGTLFQRLFGTWEDILRADLTPMLRRYSVNTTCVVTGNINPRFSPVIQRLLDGNAVFNLSISWVP